MNNQKNIKAIKENIISVFNDKVITWYKNAKIDYNVIGEAKCKFENDCFQVLYIENGKKFLSTFAICDDYLLNNKVDWLYDIWCEQSTGILITELN